MDNKYTNYYSTVDFYLACFLELRLKMTSELEKNDKDNCVFYFGIEGTKEEQVNYKNKVKTTASEFYENKEVKVIDFKNKIKDTKSRMINLLKSI